MEQKSSSNAYQLRVFNTRGLESYPLDFGEEWELVQFGSLSEVKFYVLLKRKETHMRSGVG